jgi:hypothetical protein
MACTCETCSVCDGQGYFYRNIDGSLDFYHTDDMQETEDCDFCDGTGCSEMCDECLEKYDYEDENNF